MEFSRDSASEPLVQSSTSTSQYESPKLEQGLDITITEKEPFSETYQPTTQKRCRGRFHLVSGILLVSLISLGFTLWMCNACPMSHHRTTASTGKTLKLGQDSFDLLTSKPIPPIRHDRRQLQGPPITPPSGEPTSTEAVDPPPTSADSQEPTSEPPTSTTEKSSEAPTSTEPPTSEPPTSSEEPPTTSQEPPTSTSEEPTTTTSDSVPSSTSEPSKSKKSTSGEPTSTELVTSASVETMVTTLPGGIKSTITSTSFVEVEASAKPTDESSSPSLQDAGSTLSRNSALSMTIAFIAAYILLA